MKTPKPSEAKIKEILKSQIEENRKFREMLSNFIDHKNRKALIEDINTSRERQSLKDFEEKVQELLTANSISGMQK